ncbi:MAG: DNA-processing protein DprA [Pseudohongiellaceae bacterium]|nr:DNA-processing protein DprA [Pseudohongiellaceae bacterium]
MNEDHSAHWLRLSLSPHFTAAEKHRLLATIGGAPFIAQCTEKQLAHFGLKVQAVEALSRLFNKADQSIERTVDQALNWAAQSGNALLSIDSEYYPPLLAEISDPPILLYVRGQLESLLETHIAIVGSRACSADAKRNALSFAVDLAEQGYSIVSGLAYGVDTYAHQGAINANGTTIAVMGTGADLLYPARNAALAQQIMERGALISELPLGSGPKPSHFPKRNRIISAMGMGTIVIEAALKSGSLISARLAMEQGREVFAVPGSIRNAKAQGCHQLIKDGAQLLDHSSQVSQVLAPMCSPLNPSSREPNGPSPDACEKELLSEQERVILNLIGYDLVSIDTLCASSGIAVAPLQTLLLQLELKGRIECRAGAYVLA